MFMAAEEAEEAGREARSFVRVVRGEVAMADEDAGASKRKRREAAELVPRATAVTEATGEATEQKERTTLARHVMAALAGWRAARCVRTARR